MHAMKTVLEVLVRCGVWGDVGAGKMEIGLVVGEHSRESSILQGQISYMKFAGCGVLLFVFENKN